MSHRARRTWFGTWSEISGQLRGTPRFSFFCLVFFFFFLFPPARNAFSPPVRVYCCQLLRSPHFLVKVFSPKRNPPQKQQQPEETSHNALLGRTELDSSPHVATLSSTKPCRPRGDKRHSVGWLFSYFSFEPFESFSMSHPIPWSVSIRALLRVRSWLQS